MKKITESLSSSPKSITLTSFTLTICLLLLFFISKGKDGRLEMFAVVAAIMMGVFVHGILLLDWEKKEHARMNEYAKARVRHMFLGLDGDAEITGVLNTELIPLLKLIGPRDKEGQQELYRALVSSCPRPYMEKLFDLMIMKYPQAWPGKTGKDLMEMLAHS